MEYIEAETMNPEIEKLLNVLDLKSTVKHQWLTKWIEENLPDKLGSWNRCEFSIADLAFQLRDEAVKISEIYWLKGKYEVAKIKHYKNGFTSDSCPTDWVIVALIAKELAKEKQ